MKHHTRPERFSGDFTDTASALRAVSASTGPVSLLPAAVASPRGLDDVVALVDAARAEGWALTARGGGTGMPGGNVGAGILVDMEPGFDQIEDVDIDRGIIRAGVGVRMLDLVAAASAAGLDLPPIPSSADRCTLGGVLANNAAGARSFLHGSIRPWVRGIEGVLGDGTIMELDKGPSLEPFTTLRKELDQDREWKEAWPDVTKNSSGYGIRSFHDSGQPSDILVGSEGTLGLFTRADISVRSRPVQRGVQLVQIVEMDQLPLVAQVARDAGASACEFLGDRFLEMGELGADPILADIAHGSWGIALVEVEGNRNDVKERMFQMTMSWKILGLAFRAHDTDEGMRALWGFRHRASPTIARNAGPGRVSLQFIEDCVVPTSKLTAYLKALNGALTRAGMDAVIFGHAGDANVHVNPLVDFTRTSWRTRVRTVLDEVTETVRELGGSLSGEHGDGRIRAPLLHRVWSPPSMRAFKRVKEIFDPSGILNPGVILALPGQDPLYGIHPPRVR